MKNLIQLLIITLAISSCASSSGKYELPRTAAAIGCSEENTMIHKETWNHQKMNGLITYVASCKEKKYRCSITAPFNYQCKESVD